MKNKFVDIVSSWARLMRATKEQEERAVKRTEICHSCEYLKTNTIGEVCGKCGCAIRAKVFSDNGCPDMRW
jgi:uncharacterized paraquat-inducible protein A